MTDKLPISPGQYLRQKGFIESRLVWLFDLSPKYAEKLMKDKYPFPNWLAVKIEWSLEPKEPCILQSIIREYEDALRATDPNRLAQMYSNEIDRLNKSIKRIGSKIAFEKDPLASIDAIRGLIREREERRGTFKKALKACRESK